MRIIKIFTVFLDYLFGLYVPLLIIITIIYWSVTMSNSYFVLTLYPCVSVLVSVLFYFSLLFHFHSLCQFLYLFLLHFPSYLLVSFRPSSCFQVAPEICGCRVCSFPDSLKVLWLTGLVQVLASCVGKGLDL